MTNKEITTDLLKKLKDLSAEIVTDPEQLRAFAERWRNGFRQYSLSNLFLILGQRSNATLCAGFNQWKAKERHVKAGEKAIWILAPGFVKKETTTTNQETGEQQTEEGRILKYFLAVPVFDLSQTEGKEIELGNSLVKGNGKEIDLEALAALFPYPLRVTQDLADGHTDGKEITVSSRPNHAQMIAAYLHELSHCLLHYEDGERQDVSRELAELQAEACAYITSAALGIDNQGAKLYLGNWNGDREKLEGSSLKIISAAEKILSKIKTANLI